VTFSSHSLSRPSFVACQSTLAPAWSAEELTAGDNRGRGLVFTRAIFNLRACALFAHEHESVDFTNFTPRIRARDFTLFTLRAATWHSLPKDLRRANRNGCVMNVSPTSALTSRVLSFCERRCGLGSLTALQDGAKLQRDLGVIPQISSRKRACKIRQRRNGQTLFFAGIGAYQ
jgi:hypothetical protein